MPQPQTSLGDGPEGLADIARTQQGSSISATQQRVFTSVVKPDRLDGQVVGQMRLT